MDYPQQIDSSTKESIAELSEAQQISGNGHMKKQLQKSAERLSVYVRCVIYQFLGLTDLVLKISRLSKADRAVLISPMSSDLKAVRPLLKFKGLIKPSDLKRAGYVISLASRLPKSIACSPYAIQECLDMYQFAHAQQPAKVKDCQLNVHFHMGEFPSIKVPEHTFESLCVKFGAHAGMAKGADVQLLEIFNQLRKIQFKKLIVEWAGCLEPRDVHKLLPEIPDLNELEIQVPEVDTYNILSKYPSLSVLKLYQSISSNCNCRSRCGELRYPYPTEMLSNSCQLTTVHLINWVSQRTTKFQLSPGDKANQLDSSLPKMAKKERVCTISYEAGHIFNHEVTSAFKEYYKDVEMRSLIDFIDQAKEATVVIQLIGQKSIANFDSALLKIEQCILLGSSIEQGQNILFNEKIGKVVKSEAQMGQETGQVMVLSEEEKEQEDAIHTQQSHFISDQNMNTTHPSIGNERQQPAAPLVREQHLLRDRLRNGGFNNAAGTVFLVEKYF